MDPPDHALIAYEATAPHYDRLTAHHDYGLWLGNLLPALSATGLHGNRLLDVACGTGKSFLPMLDRGWSVTAVDISPAMLAIAHAKAKDEADLHVADMRALPRLGTFHLVWCLDDAVNYLLSLSDLELALRGMARNLASDGLLLFDVNTLAMYRGFFAATELFENGTTRLVWNGKGDGATRAGQRVHGHLDVEDADGVVLTRAWHRQRHHPVDEIRDALAGAGLECVAVFGHGYNAVLERPLDESRHTKAILIARLKRERR